MTGPDALAAVVQSNLPPDRWSIVALAIAAAIAALLKGFAR